MRLSAEAALRDGGVALDDDPEEALDDGAGLLTVLADGRWASASALSTHRGDLIRFLASFPETHGESGVMNRIRAALGLQ